MTGTNFLEFQYINQVLKPAEVSYTAFILHFFSYTVSNTVFFNPFLETAIGYYFY